ncbi:MAG: transcriptional repressor [Cyanobacteria bacterium HKST-UBA04]|nr:transcriptional repressor [Cyanobacteria bacterium HKST-UBA04]
MAPVVGYRLMLPPSSTTSPSYSSKKPPRSTQVVLDALGAVPHASVQELHDWLRANRPKRSAGLTTIYRTLHYLVQQHQVQRVYLQDGQARYDLLTKTEHPHHHHHLVCTRCQHVEVLHDCPLETLESLIESAQTKFKLHYHNLELFGLCESCQAG